MEKLTERLKDKLYAELDAVYNSSESIFSTTSLRMLPVFQRQEVYRWCFTVVHHHLEVAYGMEIKETRLLYFCGLLLSTMTMG